MDTNEINHEWRGDQYDFHFDVHLPQHIPRAWERLPKSPHTTRHRGKKVWKRPEPRGGLPYGGDGSQDEDRLALSEKSTNTSRVVKRLRLKDGMGANTQSKENLFHATLKDTKVDTPKRKQRDVAQFDFKRQPTESPNGNIPEAKAPESAETSTIGLPIFPESSILATVESLDAAAPTRPDPPGCSPQKQPKLPENVPAVEDEARGDSPEKAVCSISPSKKRGRPRKYPQSPLPTTINQDQAIFVGEVPNGIEAAMKDHGSSVIETGVKLLISPSKAGAQTSPRRTPGRPRKRPLSPVPTIQVAEVDTSQKCHQIDPKTPKASTENDLSNDLVSASNPVPTDHLEPHTQSTPVPKAVAAEALPTPTPSLFNLDSPQIGTTLLRRESLRRRGSPSKWQSTKRGKSPQKKQLKKRDTLQEREILQKFTEGDKEGDDGILKQSDEDVNAEAAGAVVLPESTVESGLPQQNKEALIAEAERAKGGDHEVLMTDDTSEENKEGDAGNGGKETEAINATDEADQERDVAANSCEAVADADIDEAAQIVADVCEQAELPSRKTRSGARFSDDTSMLKDFLSRAQASKAAKTIVSPKIAKTSQTSSAKSPKKAKTNAIATKTNGHSSQKRTRAQGASPEKVKLEVTFGDDLEEEAAKEPEPEPEPEPANIRRSTRSRLPAPPKAQQNGPSLIPVRRADGADPLVLQKTQAQELAIVTRANTRRNKGQARPPQYALKDLPTHETELEDAEKVTVSNGKAVTWAETLASYQEGKEATDEQEEQRPKVRRLRGLGGVNGTPAAKKKATAAAPSNGTPAPKRRGRTTG